MILAGWAVYGLFCLAMGLNGFHTLLLWPLFAYYGLFLAATEGAEKALVADLAPPDRLGTAYGWFNLTAGVMLLPASIDLWPDLSSRRGPGRLRGFRPLRLAGGHPAAAVGLARWRRRGQTLKPRVT